MFLAHKRDYPDSVTSIDNSAFYNCSSLASVTIPDSVTSIGWYAFNYCYSLESVTIPERFKKQIKNIFPKELFKLFGGAKIKIEYT